MEIKMSETNDPTKSAEREGSETEWQTVAFAPAPDGWRALYLHGGVEPIAGWLTQENRHARRVVAAIASDSDAGELVPATDWATLLAIYGPGHGASDYAGGLARRVAAGSELAAAVELAPRTQSDGYLRAEIENTTETLRTRSAYTKAMPDADERLAKRDDWDAEHMWEMARGVAAGDELAWRQRARKVPNWPSTTGGPGLATLGR
jgi:hypothetical protein